jgi:hypothetical protein
MEFKNQKKMFEYIWDDREHISELTGKALLPRGHPKHHWQFAHILGKGAYPSYKLNPDNIMLCLPEEHENQEQYEIFIERHDELRRNYYREFYNKEF